MADDDINGDFSGALLSNHADVYTVSGGEFFAGVHDYEILAVEIGEDGGGCEPWFGVSGHLGIQLLPLLGVGDDVGSGFLDAGLVSLGDVSVLDGFPGRLSGNLGTSGSGDDAEGENVSCFHGGCRG